MDDYKKQIAELETEREELNVRLRAIAEQRLALDDEYDYLVKQRMAKQGEINGILKAEIDEIEAER